MVYKPKMARENVAYGKIPSEQAYGRVNNTKKYAMNNIYTDIEDTQEDMDAVDFAQYVHDMNNAPENSGLKAEFDGDRLRVNYNGEQIGDFKGMSGYPSRQYKEDVTFSDKGPIPEGEYMLNYDDFQQYDKNVAATKGRNYWMNKPESWGYERISITPQEGTDTYGRDGFYVHGGRELKSGGCIDLGVQMPNFGGIIKKYRENIPLTVKYHENFGKTDSKNGKK